jgi:thiol-disulfide isomerase/thioredoxin
MSDRITLKRNRLSHFCLFAAFAVCLGTFQCLPAADSTATTDSTAARSDEKPAPLTPDQIARGQAIREVLLRGIDYARERGAWPKEFSDLKADDSLSLVYMGGPPSFDGLERHLRGQLKSVSPVVHEAVEKHPDGVWIGYADGHLEFLRDSAGLNGAVSQWLRMAIGLGEQARPLIEKLGKPQEELKIDVPKRDAKLMLKLVDDAGKPVAGAQVGYFDWNKDYDDSRGPGRLITTLGDKVSPQATTSDAAGRVEIEYQWLFDADYPPSGPAALIAQQKNRGLVGLTGIQPSAFAAGDKAAEMEVKLQRGVQVVGSLSRVGAPEGSESMWTNAYVHVFSGGKLRPMSFMSQRQAFQFLLPPGDYLLEAYGDGVYGAYRFVHINGDEKRIDLHLDLPPDQLTLLTGKPAPALRQIKAWKNGGPMALDQQRGKWVLLDFWGYWCGPCVGSMPELMELYDKYHDKGLVVIGVHDDSVASIADMDKNLEKTRKELWKGRDLPFPVALDGGGELPISGTERSTRGATHAAYGIQHWPTTILIDPQGNVVGEKSVNDPKLKELLEKELNR